MKTWPWELAGQSRADLASDRGTARLRADQMIMVADNFRASIIPSQAVVFFMAAASLLWIASPVVPLWMAATLLAMYRVKRISEALARVRDEPEKVLACESRFISAVTMRSAALAVAPLAMWVEGVPDNHVLLLVILVSGAAINTVVTAAYRPAAMTTALFCLGGMTICTIEGGAYLVGVPFFVAFGFMMKGLFKNVHRIATDMLLLRESERDLIDRLSAANRTKSNFLANMSHELRTPLNAVIGFSDVMRQQMLGPLGTRAYLDYAGDIHASGHHLLTLVNQILDLSKIEADKYELQESEFDLRALVEDARRIIALRAEQGGVRLVNEVPEGVILRADATAIRQVALNVAMNAVKFTPRGGKVRAGVRVLGDGRYCVTVRDTGCGVRPEDMERIFEPFGQGRHDIAAKEGGTGLGLPIVRALMKAHGGDAFMESRLGAGSTVFLTLPAERVLSLSAQRAAA